MKIAFRTNDLVDYLFDYLEIDDLNDAVKKLRQEFDWNPFDEDGDEYVGVWPEIHHNIELVNDVVFAVVQTLERITIGGASLQGPEKLDAAVAALDRALKLPWYAEPFDGPALRLLISQAVSLMNRVEWNLEGSVNDVQALGYAKNGDAIELGETLKAVAEKRSNPIGDDGGPF